MKLLDDAKKASILERYVSRRTMLHKHVPNCPNCKEEKQIQLVSSIAAPAEWKCRKCKHKFSYEPEVTK